MRIAVVSDIHGNLTALDAVVADLRRTGADLVVHGGDLVGSGPRSAEVIDRIRELGWPGVYGNTDEMLWRPARIGDLYVKATDYRRSRRGLQKTNSLPLFAATRRSSRSRWRRRHRRGGV